jgi:hypothetical protein
MQDNIEIQNLGERLATLERRNKRFWQLCLVPWVFLLVVALTGQSTAPRTIEANEFVLRDADGKVRARLKMEQNNASLQLYDRQEAPTVALDSNATLYLFAPDSTKKLIVLNSSKLQFCEGTSLISYLSPEGLGLHQAPGRTAAGIRVDAGDGQVFVTDRKGFQAVLGHFPLENLTKGTSITTSAASLALINPQKRVIWQAP